MGESQARVVNTSAWQFLVVGGWWTVCLVLALRAVAVVQYSASPLLTWAVPSTVCISSSRLRGCLSGAESCLLAFAVYVADHLLSVEVSFRH